MPRFLLAITAVLFSFQASEATSADIVIAGLDVHYRAEDADGNGNPGNSGTTTWVNLANPGTYDGTIIEGPNLEQYGGSLASFVENTDEPIDSPFRYGVLFPGTPETAIELTPFAIDSPRPTVSFEFWIKTRTVDLTSLPTLYGEGSGAPGWSNQRRNQVHINDDSVANLNKVGFRVNGSSSAGQYSSEGFMVDDEFVQLVIVVNSDVGITLYLNGGLLNPLGGKREFLLGTLTDQGGPYNRAVLGATAYHTALISPFNGQMSIVRIYRDTVLTEEEVYQNFLAEFGELPPDTDSDGIPDHADNCPDDPNLNQADSDLDQIGDLCDPFPDDPDNDLAQCEIDLAASEDDNAQLMTDLFASEVRVAELEIALDQCLNPPIPPTQCSDGIDNDGDGSIDLEDRQCLSPEQDSEKNRNR